MKKKGNLSPHIIAVAAFVVFILLGLACASKPEYREISPNEISSQSFTPGYHFVTETKLSPEEFFGFALRSVRLVDAVDTRQSASVEELIINESLLEERIEADKVYKVYITTNRYGDFIVDKIDGLMSIEEAQARNDRRNVERIAAEKAQLQAQEVERQAREQAGKAEQERLANLYRQAGNNYGNLRNTSKRYGMAFGNDYLTTTYNFGDGNYIEQDQTVLGLSFSPKTGTYRVNGDTVIFRSSKGEYKAGTIIGTALNIDGDIYR